MNQFKNKVCLTKGLAIGNLLPSRMIKTPTNLIEILMLLYPSRFLHHKMFKLLQQNRGTKSKVKV